MGMKFAAFLSFTSFVIFVAVREAESHASCSIDWYWDVNCTDVNKAIINQIKKWHSSDNCKDGGEKCLYTLESSTPEKVTAKHMTPKHNYVDDLTITFKPSGSKACSVHGHSTSELWYAILDYGTNYCNLHNLITGAGLDKMPGYNEKTSNSECTQYTSADCEKY